MASINAADDRRLAAIRGLFERFGYALDDADVRARTVYLVQIGYIAMQVRETPRRAARRPLCRDLRRPPAECGRDGPLPRQAEVRRRILRPPAAWKVTRPASMRAEGVAIGRLFRA